MNANASFNQNTCTLNFIDLARQTLLLESKALEAVSTRLDEQFNAAVRLILNATGKVIITGMGKSGIIAQKIAATMTSTGTPAVFMHPSEAAHGDLGVVSKGDVVIGLSKSGTTEELLYILPALKQLQVQIIAMVGNVRSALALRADAVLDVAVEKEACPYDLAPTTSTTAMLAMGDALAMALMQAKKFSQYDFAVTHPSGALGKRLTMRVADIMATRERLPIIQDTVSFTGLLLEMTSKRFGAAIVVDGETGKLVGFFTDGDLRRIVQTGKDLSRLSAKDVMTPNPKYLTKETLAKDCLETMEAHRITQMIICDDAQKPIGIVHIHDLVSLGL
ncbi:KpsF/GutQ family protein [Chloroherpeton thalassium ATCC 35110]|uniref:KpsF/GutQ family protein n=1 Tax=Chloroherpeton thalassium (strain ATCC 35110 / GB-78) TaxID=517418 RepID=B3QSH3_CHLT3|nr:KpsF/GutQ family sugar-phosphate isomerase [Chloroherpeton thalassium]ACF12564.1 KpsF/GutQ family protein [Chloroherpeton thalassium ATCC 35110]